MSADGATAELQLVRGPSALGGGRKRFADLLYLIAVTDFKQSYFGTVLGYVWSLARPLMLFGVLLFVFTQIFRAGSGVPHYPELLLFNIVLFGFFSEATSRAVTSVVALEGIVRKTQFPRLVIPLAVVLTSLFNLALNMVVVLAFFFAFGVDPTWTWLLFPVILGLLALITSAVSMLLSALYVRFRDTAIIWSVLGQVLFYATPLLYTLDTVKKFDQFIIMNPLTPIFVQARAWIVDPSADGALTAAGGPTGLIIPALLFVSICAFGIRVFQRDAPRIAEEL